MNREERIRRELPDAPDELVTMLAARRVADVTIVIAGLREARREALAAETERRRQRKADARAHNWYDTDVLAARDARLVAAAGRRAETDLTALTALADLVEHSRTAISLAVEGLRARGYSDPEIAGALNITRQAVGQTYGRRGD